MGTLAIHDWYEQETQKIRFEGFTEGESKGELKRALKVALNLLKKGMSDAEVAEITELDLEQIQQLKKDQLH